MSRVSFEGAKRSNTSMDTTSKLHIYAKTQWSCGNQSRTLCMERAITHISKAQQPNRAAMLTATCLDVIM